MEPIFDKNIVNASDSNLNSVLQNNRSLTENSLRMRAMAYLAQVKSSLLTQTIFEVDSDRKQINNYATSLDEKNKLLEEQKKLIEHQKSQIEKELKDKKELLIVQSKTAMMGEMIGLIAHQFKQPLSMISMLSSNHIASVELGEVLKDEEIKNDANETIKQIQYLSNTIDTFRDFLKPDNQKIEVNIEDVIENSLVILNKSLLNNDIELIKQYNSNYKIKVIHSELMQVFINILNNAKEAFKINNIKNRQITIRTYDKNENVIVEIVDNAGGIQPNKIDTIFDAYFTTKEEFQGTGLGLYIVKTIIEEHLNGSIEVENVDDGIIFKVTI